ATPETTLHAAYARYFTPPQTESVSTKTIALFANTPNEPEVTQSSPVTPERSHYFDLGVMQKVSPEMNIGLDSYYKIVRNMTDEAQFGPALIFSDLSYDKGYIYGVELTGNYKAGNFSTYANFAYNICRATNIVAGEWSWPQDQLAYMSNHWIYLDHDQMYTASAGVIYNLSGTVLTADATFGSGLRMGFANLYKMPTMCRSILGQSANFSCWISVLLRDALRSSTLPTILMRFVTAAAASLHPSTGRGLGSMRASPNYFEKRRRYETTEGTEEAESCINFF